MVTIKCASALETLSSPTPSSPSIPVGVSFLDRPLVVHIAISFVHATMNGTWRFAACQLPLLPANEGECAFAL